MQPSVSTIDLQGHVQHHAVVIRVRAVPVEIPIPLAAVDLHRAADQPQALQVEHGVPEVGSRGVAGTPRVEYPDLPASVGFEPLLTGGPLLPKAGQQLLRNKISAGSPPNIAGADFSGGFPGPATGLGAILFTGLGIGPVD